MEYRIANLQELDQWVGEFLKTLKKSDHHARIVTLKGDLGAGKTALVKSAARHLGISEEITSPTFVIQKEYELGEESDFKKMIHIDAYRLESASELEYLKWSDTISNPENLIFLEWPQMVDGIEMPKPVDIEISIINNQHRNILVKK